MKYTLIIPFILTTLFTGLSAATTETCVPRLADKDESVLNRQLTSQFLKMLLQRVREARRTPDEDTLDLTTILMSISTLNYTAEQLGTTELELSNLVRKVAIESTRSSIQKLAAGTLKGVDRDIEVIIVRGSLDIYNITPQQLGTTAAKLRELLK
jgi:F420-0:gamma-glutamyl ligase-like protein